MARPIFWPTNDSLVLSVGGFPNAGVPVRIYTRQIGGTQITDLLYVNPDGSLGGPVPAGVLLSDQNGLIPSFAGPDLGATTVWGDHGMSGGRYALTSGPGASGTGGGLTSTLGGTVTTVAEVAADPAFTARFPANPVGMYIPTGWGSYWYPKLAAAKAGTGQAVIAWAGHSVTRGYFANPLGKGFAGLISRDLQVGADGGTGFRTCADSSAVMQAANLPAEQTALYESAGTGEFYATTGVWGADAGQSGQLMDGPGAAYMYTSEPGATVSYKMRGTRIRIYTFSSGGFAVTIDGTPVANIPARNQVAYTEYTATAGTHQVTCTYTGSQNAVGRISGFFADYPTGVVANMYARGGAKSVELSNVANGASGSFGPAGKWSGGSSFPADLVVVGNELNDLRTASPATYARNLHLYLDGVRGHLGQANGQTDILVVLANAGLFDAASQMGEFAGLVRPMVEHYGAALVNLTALSRNSFLYSLGLGLYSQGGAIPGPSAATQGQMNGDPGHLSNVGHAWAANYLYPLITGIPAATVSGTGLASPANVAGSPAASTLPTQVAAFGVAGYDGRLEPTWVMPASGGTLVTDFLIQYRTTVGPGAWVPFAHTASPSTTANITGLTVAASYDIRVAAINANGQGPFSDPVTTVASLPPNYATDTFSRADSDTVGVSESGAVTPTKLGSAGVTFGIVGGHLAATVASTPSTAGLLVWDTGHADGTVQINNITKPSASDPVAEIGTAFRCVDASNYYLLWTSHGGSYQLGRFTAGTFTSIAGSAVSPQANDAIRIVMVGATITISVNNQTAITVTDATTFQTATQHGVWVASFAGVGGVDLFDNFAHFVATT